MSLSMRFLKSIARITSAVYMIISLCVFALSAVLLKVAETTEAQLFASAIIVFTLLPGITYITALKVNRRYSIVISVVAFLAISVLLTICYNFTPKGIGSANSEIVSVFLGKSGYQRMSVANLVPEIDQLKLGSYLISALDSFIDVQQAKKIRSLFLPVYREMRKSQEYEALGSVMNYAYSDSIFGNQSAKHFYMIVPPSVRGKSVPVLMFLHGSGGNFKAYMWKWRTFAEAAQVVVIAPSFGFGEWDRDGSPELIQEILDYVELTDIFKVKGVHLAGLSNGGIGVFRIGTKMANKFHSLILLSPVMYSLHARYDDLIEAWKSRPILVVSGTEDRRVPQTYVTHQAAILQNEGVNIRTEFIENEDHYLFFSSWDKVNGLIQDWVDEAEEATQ